MSDDEAPNGNESRMTMIEHLTELRRRLIIAFASVGLGAIIAWIFYPQIIEFLLEPTVGRWKRGRSVSSTSAIRSSPSAFGSQSPGTAASSLRCR